MIGYFDTELGRVQISPSIVRRFVQREIEKNRWFHFPAAKPGDPVSRKVLERNIRVNFTEGTVQVILNVNALYGTRLRKEAGDLIGKVAKGLTLGTGLKVSSISINVENVFEEEPAKEPLLLEHSTVRADAVNQ